MNRPVTVLLDTDEEVGSTTGHPVVEAARIPSSAGSGAVHRGQGPPQDLARKGVGDVSIKVRGRAAHSGVDFEKGRNAIVELARQLLEVVKFTEPSRGITVNPGLIQGGTRSNVVPAEAWAEVGFRIVRTADAAWLEKRFAELKPFDPIAPSKSPAASTARPWSVQKGPCACLVWPASWAARLEWRWRSPRPAAALTVTSLPRWVCQRLTALARWEKELTRLMNQS